MRNRNKGALSSVCVSGALLLPMSIMAQTPAQEYVVIQDEVYSQLENTPDGTVYVIVMLQPVANPRASTPQVQAAVLQVQDRVLSNLAADDFSLVYRYKNFAAMTGRASASGLSKLAGNRDVVAVGLDGQGEGHLNDSVPFINADDAHSLGYTGAGITVAILDTGIDSDHPDLSDDLAPGWFHFLNQGADVGAGAEDDNGHGTNVSGIITSKGQVSSVGVAPDADILAVKVLDWDSSGWVTDWAAGVDYVVTWKGNNPEANLRVINMSLGTWSLYSDCPCDNGDVYTQFLHAAIQAAKDAGIVTFASSGNQGSCTSMSCPACLSSAVAVAAVYDQDMGREPNSGTYQDAFGSSFGDCADETTSGDKIACFSNRSECNELAAPGRLISAPGLGGGLSTYTGTSQASPHCAGVASLMFQKCAANGKTLTPDAASQIMKNTGVPTDDPCSTSPVPVRVDAFSAVNAACFYQGWVSLVPVSATGTYEIAGNEIFLSEGGQSVTFEIQLSGWNPELLWVYQTQIDSAGFTGGSSGALSVYRIPCSGDGDCSGEGGGVCLTGLGFCAASPSAVIDETDPDFVFYDDAANVAVDISTDDILFVATVMDPADAASDTGVPKHAGQLILEVSPDAEGTFTVGFDSVGSFMNNTLNDPIEPLALIPGMITVGCSPSSKPETDSYAKNRYLSLLAGDAGRNQAIRVIFRNMPPPYDAWNDAAMWAGEPVEICENAGQDIPPGGECGPSGGLDSTMMVAELQCTPHYRDWTLDGWVHVYHEGIVPSAEYDVQVIDESCDTATESRYSDPLVVTLPVWGDIVGDCATLPCTPPNGSVDVTTDVTAVLDKFKNLTNNVIKSRADVEPRSVDQKVNITDVTVILDAFRGFAYPFEPSRPLPCP